jgi:hypothetical protein
MPRVSKTSVSTRTKTKTPKPPKMIAPTEHTEQKALFVLARMHIPRIPELELLHAIPNGAKLPYTFNAKGQRVSKQGRILIEEGLRAGVPFGENAHAC